MFKRAVHPGEILEEELAELGVTPADFARQIKAPPNSISRIIAGEGSITGEIALCFAHSFGVEPQFRLNLQAQYDLIVAERQSGEAVRALPTAEAEALGQVAGASE